MIFLFGRNRLGCPFLVAMRFCVRMFSRIGRIWTAMARLGQVTSCFLLTEFGASFPDADGDGICDSNDNCVGVVDECGVCNGPGPTFAVIESINILYDSVYAEQIDEWLLFEVGADTTFSFECNEGASGYDVPILLPMTSDEQRVLTEVFVGHQCGNCPPAIVVMNELIENHPSQIVPVAIHAGTLASTNGEFLMDWTTPEGRT